MKRPRLERQSEHRQSLNNNVCIVRDFGMRRISLARYEIMLLLVLLHLLASIPLLLTSSNLCMSPIPTPSHPQFRPKGSALTIGSWFRLCIPPAHDVLVSRSRPYIGCRPSWNNRSTDLDSRFSFLNQQFPGEKTEWSNKFDSFLTPNMRPSYDEVTKQYTIVYR